VSTRGLLQAGVILPVDATLEKGVPVAAQEVRSYRHAVLGDRVVARLCASELLAAEDATMEFLGFAEAFSSTQVGFAQHEAIGFPATALLSDPGNARYALGVVKGMERYARMANSRAGAAKDGFEELAGTLAKSVPHFLPGFFEQCGRIFAARDNNTYASQMFTKARAAEKTYGLRVDEERRRNAFLEFAFAGCLSGKALDEYARDLAAAYAPQEAFDHFHTLVLQRARGGLAPWAGMMDSYKRLGKAAGLDVDERSGTLLKELLASPTLRQASQSFWKSVRSVAVQLGQTDPEVRGALLNLHPNGRFSTWWLALLDDAHALAAVEALDDTDVPEAARPAGGPGAWLNRFVRSGGADIHPLLLRMAPRLRADGTEIQFHVGWLTNPEDIDYAIELGIAVALQQAEQHWYFYDFEKEGTRPLTYLCSREDFVLLIRNSVNRTIGSLKMAAVMTRVGLHPFVAEWITARVDDIVGESKGVIDFRRALAELLPRVTEEGLSLVPDAKAKLESLDIGAVVSRHVRAGILSEYAWPALEQAVASFGPAAAGKNLEFFEAWPYVIVTDLLRAVVVGPDSIVMEHDLRWVSADVGRYKFLTYVDDQLFVAWDISDCKAYWSGDPSKVLSGTVDWWSHGRVVSFPVAGGRYAGARRIAVGDASFDRASNQSVSDGRNAWDVSSEWNNGRSIYTWIEVDPATGKKGRVSLPDFAEAQTGLGRHVEQLLLLPADERLANSPFGYANGLVGHVSVRIESDGNTPERVDIVRIDGVTASVVSEARLTTSGLMDWPGQRNPVIANLINSALRTEGGLTLADDLLPQLYPGGWTPHHAFYNCYEVRNADASEVLRSVSDGTFADALAVAAQVCASDPVIVGDLKPLSALTDGQLPVLEAVRLALPAVTDERMLSGVASLLVLAAQSQRILQVWSTGPASLSGANFEAVDQLLAGATKGLLHDQYSLQLGKQLSVLAPFFAEDRPAPTAVEVITFGYQDSQVLKGYGLDADALTSLLPALLYRTLLAETPPDEREAMLGLLNAFADSPLADTEQFSVLTIRVPMAQSDPEAQLIRHPNGSRWWIGATTIDQQQWVGTALVCGPVPESFGDMSIVSVRPAQSFMSADALRAAVALIGNSEPAAVLHPDAVARFAEQTGRNASESAVILSGFRGVMRYGEAMPGNFRDALGVKARDVKSCTEAMMAISNADRCRVMIAALHGDLESILIERPVEFADRVAKAWLDIVGRQVSIPVVLTNAAGKLLNYSAPPVLVLGDIGSPTPSIKAGVKCFVSDGGDRLRFDAAQGQPATTQYISATIRCVLMIANECAPDDQWRKFAAASLRRVIEILADPGLLLEWWQSWEDPKPLERLLEGTPASSLGTYTLHEFADVSCLTMPGIQFGFLRPGTRGDSTPIRQYIDSKRGNHDGFLSVLPWIDSGAAVAYAGALDADVSGYTQNPNVSAPTIVIAAAESLGVEAASATLYLQLLTLAEPTSTRVKEWNGWSAKQLKSAAEPLVTAGHLVEAKRAGSGRDYFLPGGWADVRSPGLSLEQWKLPLYDVRREGAKYVSPFGRIFALEPFAELFAKAWERWTSGDRPGFEQTGRGLGERVTKASKTTKTGSKP
jgi:hypothetical protein